MLLSLVALRRDEDAWLDRCANRPQDSRAEFEGALAEGSAEAHGIVALDAEGVVVGWMKLAPAMALPKLFEQRLYKGLPSLKGERSGVWVIGCFLIDESWRRRGVAGALLDRGIVSARSAEPPASRPSRDAPRTWPPSSSGQGPSSCIDHVVSPSRAISLSIR